MLPYTPSVSVDARFVFYYHLCENIEEYCRFVENAPKQCERRDNPGCFKKRMPVVSVEKVRAYLKSFGADSRILEFSASSATVRLAAEALGTEAARIAKTLAFDVDGRTVLVVAAGDTKIDNRKYRAAFGKKARMLHDGEVAERTGFAPGGVCPFAPASGVAIFLDESLRRFKTVFPACGSSNSAVELSPVELEQFTPGSTWVDVCICGDAPAEARA